jgi:hypothetical protein
MSRSGFHVRWHLRPHLRRHLGLGLGLGAALLVGLSACAHLLGIRPAGPRPFEHRAHVVVGIACVRCHAGIERAGEQGPLHLPSMDTCTSCHQSPHDPRPCTGCHGTPYAAQDLAQDRRHLRFEHRRHLQRMPGACVRCHVDIARPGASLRARMGSCLGCHAHQDQFRTRDCDGCHVDLLHELTRPESHMVHGDDFLHEHGVRAASAGDLCASCHTQRFCTGCHGATAPALPALLDFANPLGASIHRAGFLARHAEQARAQPGTCATCHSEDACAGCHLDRGVAATVEDHRGSPHPPGWVGAGAGANGHGRAARRDPASCASCHSGAGEMLCVSCHRVGGIGGNPHPAGWSDRRSIHTLPCRLCHVSAGGGTGVPAGLPARELTPAPTRGR